MFGCRGIAVTTLLVAGSLVMVVGACAEDQPPVSGADIRGLYDRLEPGMTIEQLAEAAKRPQLLASQAPITSWLLWSRPASPEEGTAVLRTFFQGARLARVEYESFGDEYQRLAKGADLTLGLAEDERRRLSQSTQAVAHCEDALNAYHQILLRAQERLTSAEQQAWGRALELRRVVEGELKGSPDNG